MSSCIIGNSAADITGQSITIDLEQLVDEVLVERKKGMLATIDNIIPEETSHLQSLELEKLQARREDAQRQLKYVCSLAGDDRIKAFLLNQNHYPEIRNVVEFLKDPCEGYQAIPSPSYEDIQNIYRRVVRIYIDFIFSKPQHANLLYVDSNHVIDALLRGLGICAQCASLHHTFRIGAAVMHPSFINRLYELNYSSQSGLWKPNDTHKDTPSIYRVGTEQRQTGYLRRALTMVTNAIGLK